MEGENRGKTYHLIYNSHEEDSTDRNDRIIDGLSLFSLNSRVEISGNWHTIIRVIGNSVSHNTSVQVKDFRQSTAFIPQQEYRIPRAAVYLRPQDDAAALLGVLEAENEFRKAKLKLEGGEQRALEIIDKIIPSKRVADESSRPVDESSRPAPGNRQHTPLRTDGHGNGEGSNQSQKEAAPDRLIMTPEELRKLETQKGKGTDHDPISFEDEVMGEEPEVVTADQQVP